MIFWRHGHAGAPPSSSQPYAQKRGHGCMWGCLIAALLLSLPFLVAGGYGAWFFAGGYKQDPVLRVVGELVREDGMAQQALGPGAVITGMEGNYFSWMPGRADNAYDVTLEGPKGQGHLAVTAHSGFGGSPRLDSAILTGPDGQRYDLLKHLLLPGNGDRVIENSI